MMDFMRNVVCVEGILLLSGTVDNGGEIFPRLHCN